MKKELLVKLLSTGVAAGAVFSLCGCRDKAAEQSMRSEISELEDQVDDLNEEIRELKEENESLRAERSNTVSDNNGGAYSGGFDLQAIESLNAVNYGDQFVVYNARFNSNISEARWWDYDDTMDSPGVYNNNTKTLAFSIMLEEETDDEIYYAYYYSADPNFDSEDLNKPLYQATIGTVTYRDGTTYYNIDFTSGSREGYYVVVIASDASIAEPYIVAYARIK